MLEQLDEIGPLAHTTYRYTPFYCTSQRPQFLQIKDLWQPCVEQVSRHLFPYGTRLFIASVSHVSNSHNISNFLITLVTVVCDQ